MSLNRDDVLLLPRVIAEGPAKRRNVAGKVAFLYEVTMPHLFDQLIFFEQAARVLHKDEQNVEYAAPDGMT